MGGAAASTPGEVQLLTLGQTMWASTGWQATSAAATNFPTHVLRLFGQHLCLGCNPLPSPPFLAASDRSSSTNDWPSVALQLSHVPLHWAWEEQWSDTR